MNKNVFLALIGITIGGVGFGLITPVTVVLLEQNNAPSWINGTTAMVGSLGVFLFASYAGKLIAKYGINKTLIAGLIIWSVGAILHLFWKIYFLLYPIKFIMGVGGALIFVSTEVLINYYSNNQNRGKLTSLYIALLSVGIAVGSLLIWTKNIADWVPFSIGASLILVVLLFQILFFEKLDIIPLITDKKEKFSLSSIPVISLVAAAFYGVFESSIIVALPLYSLRNKFTDIETSYFLASFVIGGVVLTFILGLFIDGYKKFFLLIRIFLVLGVLFLLPIKYNTFYFLICIFFFIGGIIPSIYTLGLNFTIENVRPEFISQANGFYLMMYGLGTIIGPILGSTLVQLNKEFGYWGFSSLISVSFGLYFKLLKKN